MQIAITGATGFLGRYIVNHLLDEGHACRCWYRPDGDRGGFADAGDRLAWVPGELEDEAATARLVHGVDAVVHAAVAWNRRGAAGDLDFARLNVLGSLRLMHAARAAGVGRFVFISTCAVHERVLEDRALDEAHPLWPAGHYGAHKAALEKFVHAYGLGEGWAICALRPTGIYGLARPASRSKWLDVVRRVVAGRDIASAAGGKEVHAADVARAVALLLAAEPSAVAGAAFNCCDRYIAEQDVARLARQQCGSACRIDILNKGPRFQIETGKLEALGMAFGGEPLLADTVAQLLKLVACEGGVP